MTKEEQVQTSQYLAARIGWDERYGDLLTRARNWRLMAMLCAIGTIAAIGAMVFMQTRTKLSTYIVATDSVGRVVASGPADHIARADERIVNATIQDWLISWRQILSDWDAQQRIGDRVVYSHVGLSTPAYQQVSEYYRGVFKRSRTETVGVEIASALPTTPDGMTYELRWRETIRSVSSGEQTGTEDWVASITVVLNPPTDDRQLRLNPLGIYVTNVAASRVYGVTK